MIARSGNATLTPSNRIGCIRAAPYQESAPAADSGEHARNAGAASAEKSPVNAAEIPATTPEETR